MARGAKEVEDAAQADPPAVHEDQATDLEVAQAPALVVLEGLRDPLLKRVRTRSSPSMYHTHIHTINM